MASSSGRVPQGEVVMDFADGGSYIKHKLENAVLEVERRRIERDEARKAQKALEALELSKGPEVKKEDVDFIISELGVKQEQAEVALRAENGDLTKALISLVRPKPRPAA